MKLFLLAIIGTSYLGVGAIGFISGFSVRGAVDPAVETMNRVTQLSTIGGWFDGETK